MRAAPITAATTWRTLAASALVGIGLAAAGAGMASAHIWPFASHPAAPTTTRLVSAIAPPSLLRADELFKPAGAQGDASGAEVPLPSTDTSPAVPLGGAIPSATTTRSEDHPSGVKPEHSPATTEASTDHESSPGSTSEPTERPEPRQSAEPTPSAEPAN